MKKKNPDPEQEHKEEHKEELGKFDESAIRFVLNMARYQCCLKHEFNNDPKHPGAIKMLEAINEIDGHSGGTMAWSKVNAELLREIGIDKWLNKPNSRKD